jgi:hypothetical protein
MGTEYERWLIARGNVFSPSAESIIKLVDKLQAEKWIASLDAGHARKSVDNTFGDDEKAKLAASREPLPATLSRDWFDHPSREDVRLVWSTDAAEPATKYPLSLRPEGRLAYSFEIHRSFEFVYPTSKQIEAIDTVCRCGEDLAFEWDADEVVPPFGAASGIFAECEECSRVFDPAKVSAVVKNPFDGKEEEIFGGAAYRFALKIACGSCFVRDPKLAFAPELVALVSKEFGRDFYEVASLS